MSFRSYCLAGALCFGALFVTRVSLAQLSDTAERDDRLGQVAATGDFNGDGFPDLAIGVPEEDVDGMSDAGAVHVVYGSAAGLTETEMQFWSQNEKGVPNDAGLGDAFGAALAAMDYNNDGYDDLAIGVPGESFGDINEAGGVLILLGSARGLSTGGNQYLNQTLSGMPDQAENNDRFGAALAAGDFNNDGFGDLAIGVPGENVGSVVGAGAVHVFLGTESGFDPAGGQFVHQDTNGIPDAAEGGDAFGASLAAGDLNGDGFSDLAIGIPEEDVAAKIDAGALLVLYGQSSGLATNGASFSHQDAEGIEDTAADAEQFARTLVMGDIDRDGRDDLVVGIPFEAGSALAAGSIQVFYGTSVGLSAGNDQHWNQDTASLGATAGPGDLFGYALALGDYNGDGYLDLAVGAPGKTIQAVSEAGGVYILAGASNGLSGAGSRFWQQNDGGTIERNEQGDFCGGGLVAGDFNADGFAELGVGVPQEDDGGVTDIGKIQLLKGSAAGLVAQVEHTWAQNSLPERPELVDPEDGEIIVVGGDGAPVDPAEPFDVFWSESSDADGQTVTYYWQLSLTPTFNILPMNVPVGTANRYNTTVGEIGRVLGAIGILADSSFTFYHRVVATDGRGQSYSAPYAVTLKRGQIVANEEGVVPEAFALEQNYPNPFSGQTTVAYVTTRAGSVRLDIFNQLGQRVRAVVEGFEPAGSHRVDVDLSDLPSGVYLYRLQTETEQAVRTMLLVR
ncbi:MAG: FG-GAP-like repeat-containing protein [Rhodothermales bacterium]